MIYTISVVPYLFVACFMDPFHVIHVILANLLCMSFCSTLAHGGSLTSGDCSHAYTETFILVPNILYMRPIFHALLLYLRKLRYHPLHIIFDINDNISKMGYFFYPQRHYFYPSYNHRGFLSLLGSDQDPLYGLFIPYPFSDRVLDHQLLSRSQ